MVSERQGWTNGKPFIVTAEQCRAKWGSRDRDWKLRCYLCRTEASEGDTFRWVYMNSSTPSPGNFMVCRTCDFDGIAEAVRASLEDWKKTFGDYAGWSFQAFSKFHSTLFERDQLRDELEAAREENASLKQDLDGFKPVGGDFIRAAKLIGAAEKLEQLAGVNRFRMLDCNDLTEIAAKLRQEAEGK